MEQRFMFRRALKNVNGDLTQFMEYVFQCCSEVVYDNERKEIILAALHAVKERGEGE